MKYAEIMRMGAVLARFSLIVIVVGLGSAGLQAQEPQSLGAVGISRGPHQGVAITRLLPGGLAQRMGLQVDDRITAINGRALKQAVEAELMFRRPAGADLSVAYMRDGQKAVLLVFADDLDRPLPPVPTQQPAPPAPDHANQVTILQDTSNRAVSVEFAKAANLALVAIKNSDTTGDARSQTVATAINDADAAAVSDSETAVLREIKGLSFERPLLLALLDLAADAPAGSRARDEWSKEMGDLQRENDCIAGWRLRLRNLSGDKPKECEAKK